MKQEVEGVNPSGWPTLIPKSLLGRILASSEKPDGCAAEKCIRDKERDLNLRNLSWVIGSDSTKRLEKRYVHK